MRLSSYLTALVLSLLVASVSYAQGSYLVRAVAEPNGMVGYQAADGQWALPPCADRLPLDSVYLLRNKDYRFVASFRGKMGIVDMKGNWTVPPIYQETKLLSPNRPYFTNGGFYISPNALPTDHIQAVVAVGDGRRHTNREMYLLDVETGAKIMSKPFYAVEMPSYRGVDVNHESKLIVLNRLYYEDKTLDSIQVLDFNGNEIVRPFYHTLTEDNYYTNGKKTDMVPYFTSAVDGQPVIAYLKSKNDLDMVCKYNHKVASGDVWNYKIVLMDINGKELPFKPLDKDWQSSADYRFDPAPVAKALAKTKDTQTTYAQISDAYADYTSRIDQMLAERAAQQPIDNDWTIVSSCQDTLFSIIRQGDRYGILASRAKVTIPCNYTKVTEIEHFPGVFLIENEYGKGLSDGFSVTAPTGFDRLTELEDGILELTVKGYRYNYKEYADSSGMIFANNLDDLFEIAFPDDNVDPKSHNMYEFSAIGDKLGRRNLFPLARLNFAVKLENAGYYEEAYTNYKFALDEDSRLSFAKERIDDLKPIVEQISRNREAAIKAERRARAEQVAAALSQFAVAFNQMAQSINNLSHRQTATPQRTTTVQRPSNSGTVSSTPSRDEKATRQKDNKPTPTAGDIMRRNREHKLYGEWEHRLECMKNRWYPYSDGKYTQSEVSHAQSQMREIRQHWEARGLWIYGTSPMETWNGR